MPTECKVYHFLQDLPDMIEMAAILSEVNNSRSVLRGVVMIYVRVAANGFLVGSVAAEGVTRSEKGGFTAPQGRQRGSLRNGSNSWFLQSQELYFSFIACTSNGVPAAVSTHRPT